MGKYQRQRCTKEKRRAQQRRLGEAEGEAEGEARRGEAERSEAVCPALKFTRFVCGGAKRRGRFRLARLPSVTDRAYTRASTCYSLIRTTFLTTSSVCVLRPSPVIPFDGMMPRLKHPKAAYKSSCTNKRVTRSHRDQRRAGGEQSFGQEGH